MATGVEIIGFGESIGKGSFGEVLIAMGADGGKFAAKKIPKEEVNKTFAEEIGIFIKIQRHDNIVRYYGHFEDNDFQYIVLEYCHLGSLNTYILQNGNPFQYNDITSFFIDVAGGLKHLHVVHDILHRDIKTENILVTLDTNTRKIVCKLTDFGISKCYSTHGLKSKIYTKKIHGTPYFMAPEVQEDVEGKGYLYVAPSDVFSLGAVYLAVAMKTKITQGGRDVIAPFFLTQEKTKHTIADAIHFDFDISTLATETLQSYVSSDLAVLIGRMLMAVHSERPDIDSVYNILQAIDLKEFLKHVDDTLSSAFFKIESLEEPEDREPYMK